MSSSIENMRICGVCFESLKPEAIFTAECAHSFHIICIACNSANVCPICLAEWKEPTSIFPSEVEYEPPFADDELLPETVTETTLSCRAVGTQKVAIKAVPERPAVAASEASSEFSVLVGLKASTLLESVHQFRRAPVDLVMVLDVSSSMRGSKLSLLKRAVHFVIDNLSPCDRLSIVSFANEARRISPLCRMTSQGREDARRAVDALCAGGLTNIIDGLQVGTKVLKDRRRQNPVASIMFLSDGKQSSQFFNSSNQRWEPTYLTCTRLPSPRTRRDIGTDDLGQQKTFPVHSFGFGTDHEPVAMHAIADLSGGTFSFIESYEMLQDAFATCIGGLLSVVAQDLRLSVRPASPGVEIKSIHSGRFATETSKSQGTLNIGDVYADEEKEFLISLSIPLVPNDHTNHATVPKMSLLDIACAYTGIVSKERVQIEGYLVDIRRPRSISPQDMVLNTEVDRQKNSLSMLRIIAQAQQMAETGNLAEAQAVLSKGRSNLLASSSAQAGDTLCMWLDSEMEETRKRMVDEASYLQRGQAYALSMMCSLASQRASSRGNTVARAEAFGSGSSFIGAGKSSVFGAYVTPNMAYMVSKSRKLGKWRG